MQAHLNPLFTSANILLAKASHMVKLSVDAVWKYTHEGGHSTFTCKGSRCIAFLEMQSHLPIAVTVRLWEGGKEVLSQWAADLRDRVSSDDNPGPSHAWSLTHPWTSQSHQ